MCGVRLLGLEENLDRPAKTNGMRCYGHALKRDNNDVLRRTSNFEVVGRKIAWATEDDMQKAG